MITKFIKLFKIIIPILLVIASSNAHAVRWVGEAGIHGGGDELASATFTNGDTTKINAGELLSIGIGPQIDLTDNTNIRVLVGWKFDSTDADNGSIKFSRFPIDVMYFYQTPQWNFGAGITYHLSPELSSSGVASGISADFEDALGFIAEVDFRLGEFFYIGGKYTAIDYDQKNTNVTVDGNSVGIVFGFIFGDK